MSGRVRLFLGGDVMTGRGIDQVLQHPGDPALHEPFVQSALDYVTLAEARSGPIPRGVDARWIWGDALEELARSHPDARIVNLETAITRRGRPEAKGINYRMHPANAAVLHAAAIDCCVLANNHVLDWGEAGLLDTLETLHGAGVHTAGAGRDRAAARAPAALPLGDARRVLVFALATGSSGVPRGWAAAAGTAGVNLLPGLSRQAVDDLGREVAMLKRPGDVAIASLHWGGNWGYAIPDAHIEFAHALIERAGIDLVHGHSSHHPLAIELYRGRLVLYGCGDFINDYEGIAGHASYRPDLGLMYLPEVAAADGRLLRLEVVALLRRRFRLERAAAADTRWLCAMLEREGARFGTRIRLLGANWFELDDYRNR